MSVVLITGLSGSGKTTALRALEDLGYFAMDNVPVVLLAKVVELADAQETPMRIAVVVDARDAQNLADAGGVVDQLRADGEDITIVYLRAGRETIIKRYKETRRRHPLESAGNVEDAIAHEAGLLQDLEHRADITIDTTRHNVHELKKLVQGRFAASDQPRLRVTFVSFGFKHGALEQADVLFDVRFLQNPYFVPELKALNGTDDAVRDYVLEQEDSIEFTERVLGLLRFLIPRYDHEGKAYVTVGFGCTGGKHRSVAIAELIAEAIRSDGWTVGVEHRDRTHWVPTIGRR